MSTQLGGNQFQEIFEEAKKQYERDTKTKLDDLSGIPDDIEGLMKKIDDDQAAFSAYRAKGEAVRKALNPVISLFKLFTDAVTEGISHAPVSGYQMALYVCSMLRRFPVLDRGSVVCPRQAHL